MDLLPQLDKLSALFSALSLSETRLALCRLFQGSFSSCRCCEEHLSSFSVVADRDATLTPVVPVLFGLNAVSKSRSVDADIDFDTRLKACTAACTIASCFTLSRQTFFEVNDVLYAQWSYAQLLPVIHNHVYFMQHADFSLRRSVCKHAKYR